MGATLKDVAKAAGVAMSTVSYAINGTGHRKVSEDVKKHILETAKKLGYTPNLAGRILNGGRSGLIGIVIPMSVPWVYGDVHTRIYNRLCKAGYHCAFGVALDPKERLSVLADMESRHAEGVIFFNNLCKSDMRDLYKAATVPIVTFDGIYGELNVDLELGTRLAVRHIIEHGHRKIGYFTLLYGKNTPKEKGFMKELEANGIKYDRTLVVESYENPNWMTEMLSMIRSQKVTAVFCNNDNIAGKLMTLLSSEGIRIPEDLTVIGFDGDAFGSFLKVPLTTIVQPVNSIVERLSDIMVEKIAKNELSARKSEVLNPYLHIRSSCGCQYSLPKTDMNGFGFSVES